MPRNEGLPGLDSSLKFSLDPLDHLFIVIHGAGDPYVDHQPWLSSLNTCILQLENNYHLVSERLQKSSRRSSKTQPPPAAMFLPVEWHQPAFETWQAKVQIAEPVGGTASTAVRTAVAESLGDVLMMSSHFWRSSIARLVYHQINEQLSAVRRNRPNFSGTVSIVAHSISAMIVTELLAGDFFDLQLDAIVFLGCPIAAYSVLAPGEHQSALATIRKKRQHVRFFNIFHPMDPVAFRLEPFMTDGEKVEKAIKVAPQKRTFWDDVGLFWDDVVYSLWSLGFATDRDRVNENGNGSEQGGIDSLFSFLGNDRKRNSHAESASDSWRHSEYITVSEDGEDKDEKDSETGGGEVLLSRRMDFELQDGAAVAPFDVMASWGAVKAHQYYWESVDVAQMLLDISITSERALAHRSAESSDEAQRTNSKK
ncbi:unnamed protein product [Agarophyton chilense]